MLSDSPPDRDLQWTETGIVSSYKFINRLWDLVEKYENYSVKKVSDTQTIEILKENINFVTEYIETFQFNKAVAKIYEYVNTLSLSIQQKGLSKDELMWCLKKLCIILQPFVPHISEEIWSNISGEGLCINQKWTIEVVERKKKVKIAVQINGKTKDVLEVAQGLTKEQVIEIIHKSDKIKKGLENKKIIREIYVEGKIFNFVV